MGDAAAGLQKAEAPAPQAVLAIESRLPLEELMSFYVDEALVVMGATLRDLEFPEGSSVTLIVRGNRLIPPRGRRCYSRGIMHTCWHGRRTSR